MYFMEGVKYKWSIKFTLSNLTVKLFLYSNPSVVVCVLYGYEI